MKYPRRTQKMISAFIAIIFTLSSPVSIPPSIQNNPSQTSTLAPANLIPAAAFGSLNDVLASEGIEINGKMKEEYADILTPGALRFVAGLQRAHNQKRLDLVSQRDALQIMWDRDPASVAKFRPETEWIREGEWETNTLVPVPEEMQYRPVEITGPAQDPKMVINALNSADVDGQPGTTQFMADFEDSAGEKFDNMVRGQINMKGAVNRTLTFQQKKGDKVKDYKLNEKLATLLVRPRGLHLEEKHVLVDGQPVSGSLFDFALYLYHNHEQLKKNGSAPYYYLPKLESYEEAMWWDKVITDAEKTLGIPVGTIKVTVLLETLPQSYQAEEIIWALREHFAGFNAGRWDYIFSYIKKLRNHPQYILPDRKHVGMKVRFMKAYVLNLIRATHKRDVHAMGGMSAFIPSHDPDVNENAMAKVEADKVLEFVDRGHDGTWIAHPGLALLARGIADKAFDGKPNQKDRQLSYTDVIRDLSEPEDFVEGKEYTREEYEAFMAQALIDPSDLADKTITEEGVRVNASVGIEYLANFLVGRGAVAINNLMEDMATAEISRSQLWQWVRHSVETIEGDVITPAYLERIFNEELEKLIQKYPQSASYLTVAKELFVISVTDDDLASFIPNFAYDVLDNMGGLIERIERGEPLVDPVAAQALLEEWENDPRWEGIDRIYEPEKVLLLRALTKKGNTMGRKQADKLFAMTQQMARKGEAVRALSAYDGVAAEQNAKAGLKAIYYSGWQEAATQNRWPDQSIYAYDSVPKSVRKINDHLQKLSAIYETSGQKEIDWMLPIVADGEAGFGGTLNVFQLMTWMIEAGAAAVHFEDQVGAEKKCGHLGGKVLVPSNQFEMLLNTARLATDVMQSNTLIVARTDADAAKLISSDSDPRDKDLMIGIIPKQEDLDEQGLKGFLEKIKDQWSEGKSLAQLLNWIISEVVAKLPLMGPSTYDEVMAFYGKNPIEDSPEAEALGIVSYARAKELGLEKLWKPAREPQKGYFLTIGGVKGAIARAIRYAPYSDLIWMETSHPDLDEARDFIEGVRGYSPDGGKTFPFKNQLFAYNNSPSFNWRAKFYAKYPQDEGESKEAYEARIDRNLKEFMIELAKMGVVFNFVTLSAFHAQSEAMYDLASKFKEDGMLAYSRLQQGEQESGGENDKHQFRAGTGLYDLVQQTLGITATQALKGSTEEEQFHGEASAEKAVASAI